MDNVKIVNVLEEDSGDGFVLSLGRFSFPADEKGPTYYPIDRAQSVGIQQVGAIFGQPLLTGVTAIVGKSETGKTALIDAISRQNGVEVFSFGEPYGYAETRPMKLLSYMHERMDKQEHKLLLIDSFKYFVYTGGNAARSKGGINVELMQQLTDLSVAAIRSGTAVVVIINLQSDDVEVITTFREAAVSSIVGLVETVRSSDATYRFRTDEGRFSVELPVWTKRNDASINSENMLHVLHSETGDEPDRVVSLINAIQQELN